MSSSPYAPAAKLLNEIWTKRKGLKSVAYSRQGELLCSKATYAQCAHVLQHKGLLDRLLRDNTMIEAKNTGLLYVLLYELVLGPNKKIRGGGALKRQLVQNKEGFMETLRQIQPDDDNDNDDNEHDDLNNATTTSNSITIPRYVRVNTLQTTVPEVVRHLKEQKNMTVFQDEHVPDLLVVPPTADSRAALQDLLLKNHIVLQDKSSCFSAFCLVHGYSSDLLMSTNTITDTTTTNKKKKASKATATAAAPPIGIIDACAAPGNKTNHLAALTTTTSTTTTNTAAIIYAFDKSKDRFQMLQRRMDALTGVDVGQEDTAKSTTTATFVECHNLDFFKASSSFSSAKATTAKDHDDDHQNFDNVRAIMLDPSCSGSGMASNHQEASRDPFFVDDRVKSLSKFQLQALQHATSLEHFPLVERVVYSTCSLYSQENEQVVATFLKDQEAWMLVAPKCLQGWKRRGLAYEGLTEAQSNALVRVHPEEDATNGFFVACLERRRIHPSKTPPSKNHTTSWRGVPPIEGLQFYHGEFHHKEEPAVKQSSPVTTKKRKSAETSSTDKRSTTKDDIILQPGKKARHDATTTDNPSSRPVVDDSSKLRKKIAKKLEWKRKQRERKQARLLQKSKPKENTDETGSK